MKNTDKTPIQIVAENIRRLRKAKGWTQLELGVAIDNKTGSTVQSIERGMVKSMPHVGTLERIAKELGVTYAELTRDQSARSESDGLNKDDFMKMMMAFTQMRAPLNDPMVDELMVLIPRLDRDNLARILRLAQVALMPAPKRVRRVVRKRK